MNTIDDFKQAYASRTYWWEPQDRPVVWACTDQFPGHTVVEEVFAKVSLVNRLYRANLHLGGKLAEWKLAEKLVKRRFDIPIAPLRGLTTFDRAALPTILEVHERLVEIGREVTGRSEVSFAAKYLSFHFPDVIPVYDRKADKTTRILLGSKIPAGPFPDNWNWAYGRYCEALLILISHLPADDATHRLKRVDGVLYDPDS